MTENTFIPDVDINVSKIVCYEQRWQEGRGYSLYMTVPRPNHGLTCILADIAEYTLADGTSFKARRGDIVYVPEGALYSVVFGKPDESGVSSYLINFSIDRQITGDLCKIVKHDADGELLSAFAETAEIYKGLALSSFKLKAIVYSIFASVFENEFMSLFAVGALSVRNTALDRGIAYIQSNIDKVISIGELASMCHMGESTFRREFTRRMGIPPLKYINFLKVEKAKLFLANADFNISDIPETLGFYDLSHFYKVFKSVTELTPSQFRDELVGSHE